MSEVTTKRILVPREQTSQYLGRCPKCNAQHIALLVNRTKFMPPPAITAICRCALPVTQLQMFYEGPIRQLFAPE